MRFIPMVFLFMAALPAFAHNSRCETLLDPREHRMATLLHEMVLLKREPATPRIITLLNVVNDEILAIASEQLTRHEVNHVVVAADADAPFGIVTEEDYERWESEIAFLKWQIQEHQKTAVESRSVSERDLAKHKLFKAQQKKVETEKLLAAPAPSFSKISAASYAYAKPHIRLVPSDDNPSMLQHVQSMYPAIPILLSAQYISHTPEVLGSVHNGILFYSLAQTFSANFGNDQLLAHEATHLEHGAALHAGEELPYFVAVVAREGETLPGASHGFYDQAFDLGELDTWDRDMTAAGRSDYIPLRRHFGGHVYIHSAPDAVNYTSAESLLQLAAMSKQAVDAIVQVLEERPQDIAFFHNPSGPSTARVEWKAADGRVIADISVHLVKLSPATYADRFLILSQYLEKVESAIRLHRFRATDTIASYGGKPPPQRWLQLDR
ncbi:MAG: hypothetical protein KF799_04150 [Bdellovibrionales bacterium]|nr:hypothetical protein [Bdellovibrionales bacterium]